MTKGLAILPPNLLEVKTYFNTARNKLTFQIKVYKGTQILPYAQRLAEMRLKASYEFPYLYVGNMEDELKNVQEYALTPQGLLVVAVKEDRIAGIFSGMPLETPGSFLEHWSKKLHQQGLKTDNIYYAGEIIVEPEFQKQRCTSQLISRFFQEVEAMNFPRILSVTSIRPYDHLLRPQNYVDIDSICEKCGFEKSSMVLSAIWPTRQVNGSVKKAKNQLACWIREKTFSSPSPPLGFNKEKNSRKCVDL